MPVIVTSREDHPFLPSLSSGAAIEQERAARQDIRPLEIVILNLMADKLATEKQLALWLGNTTIQVRLTFATTDSYVESIKAGHRSRNTDPEHIRKFYKGWSEIKDQKFDGLIVTGVNALQENVKDEIFWPEVEAILRWSETNIFSSLFLCWGAQAAMKHFHNIDNIRGKTKTYGVFEHSAGTDKSGLLFGMPDRFPIPISRWKNPDIKALSACVSLESVAISEETGANIMAESALFDRTQFYPKRLYVLNHPEYETETLKLEYLRDRGRNPETLPPRHYFPNNDPNQAPLNNWRYTAHFYTNWVKIIYEATPYDLAAIPTVVGA